MRNLFYGLDADQWEQSAGWPSSPYKAEPLTEEDVKAGIVAMLRRLDGETGSEAEPAGAHGAPGVAGGSTT